MLTTRSLSTRLLLFIGLWLFVALISTGILLSSAFRQSAERDFQNLLQAHVYNVMGAIEVSSDGKLSGQPDLVDPRFVTPLSGWYWAVSIASDPQKPLLSSRSITGREQLTASRDAPPFTDEFRRSYAMVDEQGAVVQRLEAQLFLGDSTDLFQVTVAGNRGQLESNVSDFNARLLWFFGLLGWGTLVALYLSVRLGLRPLRLAVQSLVDVREGRKEQLDGDFPSEVEPLANEINALIDANKSVTERARTQVGNLAHALKTPLAVILNETAAKKQKGDTLVAEQAGLMQLQIRTYLDRARIAAQRGVIGSRTDAKEIANRLLRVMKRLSPHLSFSLSAENEGDLIFLGEEQDLEEVLGNLMENASRFARKNVKLSLKMREQSVRPQLLITVEDDGPGLDEKEMALAVKRGQRLDESEPGSGLGLSIVRDIANEYGGDIALEKSSIGGLSVAVFLPSISAS